MQETVFFNFDGVTVSNSQFIVRSQTYAMHSVTSVKPGVVEPKHGIAILILFVGFLLLIGEMLELYTAGVLLIAGAVVIIIGLIAWYIEKPKYAVVLNTSAGKHHALVSNKKQDIEHVLQALNQAIVSRG